MTSEMITGMIIIFLSLGFILYIALRSRKTIELIHQKKLNSAREIIETINGKR